LQYTFTLKPGTNNITLYITYSAWLVIVIDDVNFGLPLSSSSYSFAYTVTQGRLSATLSFPYCPTFTAYASGTVNNTRVVSYVVTNTNATYRAKLVYLGQATGFSLNKIIQFLIHFLYRDNNYIRASLVSGSGSLANFLSQAYLNTTSAATLSVTPLPYNISITPPFYALTNLGRLERPFSAEAESRHLPRFTWFPFCRLTGGVERLY